MIKNAEISAPIDRGNRRLIADRDDVISVIGSEASAAYGKPITYFSRLWIMAGSHIVFVVDHIEAERPVTTVWNWLVNNRDGKTEVIPEDNSLKVRLNWAGMQLFHVGEASLAHPVYGYVHDAYHVEPNHHGEGKPRSGLVYRFTEKESKSSRTVVHAIALDDSAFLNGWQLKSNGNRHTLTNDLHTWTLTLHDGKADQLSMESGRGGRWNIVKKDDLYSLHRVPPVEEQ